MEGIRFFRNVGIHIPYGAETQKKAVKWKQALSSGQDEGKGKVIHMIQHYATYERQKVRFIWTSRTGFYQHNTQHEHPCPQWDWTSQSQ